MTFFIYLLLSKTKKNWYIDSTNNLVDRLKRHNRGSSRSTKRYRPWQIAYYEKFPTRSEAFRREMFLKSPLGYQELLGIKKKAKIG